MVQRTAGGEAVFINRLQPIVDALRSLANELATVAQQVEQSLCKRQVGGSRPPSGSTPQEYPISYMDENDVAMLRWPDCVTVDTPSNRGLAWYIG